MLIHLKHDLLSMLGQRLCHACLLVTRGSGASIHKKKETTAAMLVVGRAGRQQ